MPSILDLDLDLDSLTKWSEDNISFNKVKSFLIHFSLKSSPIPTSYCIDGQLLDIRDSCRDLGVIISHNLSWSDHIRAIVSKAYKMLGLLRRTFKSTSVFLRRTLYITISEISTDILLPDLETPSIEGYTIIRGCTEESFEMDTR